MRANKYYSIDVRTEKYLIVGLVFSGVIFVVDTQIPLGVAGGMLYVVLVLLGLMTGRRSFVIYAAFLGSVLNAIGLTARK